MLSAEKGEGKIDQLGVASFSESSGLVSLSAAGASSSSTVAVTSFAVVKPGPTAVSLAASRRSRRRT